FQQEVALSFETQASLHEELESVPLASESIDDFGARLDERSHEHELGQDGEIEDKRRGEERILALVEDVDDAAAAHADFAVKKTGQYGFGQYKKSAYLMTTRWLGAQVPAVIVAKMVIAGNAKGLDTSVDQELGEDRLDFGLARLEIVTTNERLVLLSELNATRNESVLRSTIDEGASFEDSSDSKEGRRRDLIVRVLDRFQEVVGGVVDALDDLAIALSVGGPENDDAVTSVGFLELANILAEVLEVGLLVGTGDKVIRTFLLVGSDKVRVVDTGKRVDGSHQGRDLALQVVGEDLGASHGGIEGSAGNVPSANDEVVGVNGGEHIGERNMDVRAGRGVHTETEGGSAENGANVVGLLDTLLGAPVDIVTVGKNRSGQSGAVVATQADHHQAVHIPENYIPELGDLPGGPELKGLLGRADFKHTILVGDGLAVVVKSGRDVVIRVLGPLAFNDDRELGPRSGRMDFCIVGGVDTSVLGGSGSLRGHSR
ncbi:9423_t:CDS:2, partial [Acaulospora colombiana]